jgi:molybdopterin-guanine dinucleotide biosynthesis protein
LQPGERQDLDYVEASSSPTFPDFAIVEGFSQFIAMSLVQGSSVALRAFRRWVREQIDHKL